MANRNVQVLKTDDDNPYRYLVKFIFVGDYGCGKTSLLLKSRNPKANLAETYSTIGIDFGTKTFKTTSDKTFESDNHYKLHLWDCGGQRRYQGIVQAYFREANALIVVFDLTDYTTFENVEEWIELMKSSAKEDDLYEIMIVGNKTDRVNDRKVKYKDAIILARKYGAHYIETSALTNQNIEEMFEILVEEIDQKNRDGFLPKIYFSKPASKEDLGIRPAEEQIKCCLIS
jgi:small GTP-binding protein